MPTVVMGGSKDGSDMAGSGAMQLIDLLTAKTARDLAVDWGLPGLDKTKK